MTVELPFGDRTLPVTIPDKNLVQVLSPNSVQAPEDQEALIEQAIDEPIGSPPLEELIRDIEEGKFVA